jgi:hypothetical protein
VGGLLRDDGFRVAVVVALAGGALAWWCATQTMWRVPPAAVTLVAALAGMRAKHQLTFSLVLGLALLGVAALVARHGGGRLSALVAVLAGAGVLVGALPDAVPGWVALVVTVSVVAVTPVVELRARRWGRLAPLAVLGAVAGVYACVPETDLVRPLLGASVVVALFVLVPGVLDGAAAVVHLGWGVVAALAIWAGSVGSIVRPGGVIGAIACVGALVLFPAVPPPGARWHRSWWVAAGTTALLVVWCSRVAGRRESGWLAALLAAAGFAVAAGVVVLVEGTRRRRP